MVEKLPDMHSHDVTLSEASSFYVPGYRPSRKILLLGGFSELRGLVIIVIGNRTVLGG